MIACVDAHYRNASACAACVALEQWMDAIPLATYRADIVDIAPYKSGRFYRRELPCLLAVLRLLPVMPEIIVIDGYVWLSAERKPGLGAHLYSELNGACAVVGVAKTEFIGVCDSPLVARVLRGKSKKPLYVSSAGIDLDCAAALVKSMHGEYRVPSMLRLADQVARSRPPIKT